MSRNTPFRSFSTRAALLTTLALTTTGLAACGGETTGVATAPTSSTASFPVTVDGTNGEVTIPAAPKAIVSLSPSATEMLYAIGAGGQVKAVDDQSNFPAEAPRTKLSGFQPSAEAVAAYNPDLVVVASDANGLLAGLKTLKVPTLQLSAAATLTDTYSQLATLGTATGHETQAKDVASDVQTRISAAVASVTKPATALKVYHELDPTYYSVTSETFVGSIYEEFGLKNIADASPKAAGGYPQLSAEYVTQAQPDVVVLADGTCCGQSAATFAARPAFATLPAVTNKKVLVISDDIASRWGPRVADFAEAVAAGLKAS